MDIHFDKIVRKIHNHFESSQEKKMIPLKELNIFHKLLLSNPYILKSDGVKLRLSDHNRSHKLKY